MVDPQTGKVDFSFASAWHPEGRIFATGNQDKTLSFLGCLKLVKFMAMEEPADFCMCMIRRFEKEQEIDLFGEISVVSFSPDTESLFIGVWDRNYGSLFQYNRCRSYSISRLLYVIISNTFRKEIENRHYTATISCSVIMMGDIVREEEIGHDGIEPMESM
ncbi:hypothetical protein NC653_035637 [Populus alba x Populus x berolinensis]|uniref:Uncharacterized protein n=1 Tax=Populus alba x Populus x berolinensis TaxID=444605 RepID=A0AAD6LHU8_9ROSI|nr:hypothetical protein NC653_035637 [Populus alba x Populus x berolinensis]